MMSRNAMYDEVMRRGVLDHQTAVHEIPTKFGREFIYENENGNPAIKRDVLNEFEKLGDSIVWSKSSLEWRKRQPYDKPERQQD